MIQKIPIAILIVFSFIFICTTDAIPIEDRAPGQVAFCDFTGTMTGRIIYTELTGKIVREIGQVNTGFPDKISLYQYQIDSYPLVTIPSSQISPPGVKPYQSDITDTDITEFIGKSLTVFRNGVPIGSCNIKLVGH